MKPIDKDSVIKDMVTALEDIWANTERLQSSINETTPIWKIRFEISKLLGIMKSNLNTFVFLKDEIEKDKKEGV